MPARKRTREQRSLDKGRVFITAGDLLKCGPLRSQATKLLARDVFLKSAITPAQVYFMRFVGVPTPRQWLLSDRYREYSKSEFSNWCNLRRRYVEGAKRIQLQAAR